MRAGSNRIPPRYLDLPDAAFQPFHGASEPVPAVEIAYQVHLIRSRRPFTVYPAVLGPVQAVIQISVRKIDDIRFIP